MTENAKRQLRIDRYLVRITLVPEHMREQRPRRIAVLISW
jgi:hypothetical protein